MNTHVYNTLKIFFPLGLILSFGIGQAQISREGVPPSFSMEGLSYGLPVITMEPLDRQVIGTVDENLLTSPGPYRIGKTMPVNVSVTDAGLWEELPDGGRVWRLKLYSEGALALSLYFDRFWLPAGSELYAYNEMKTQVIGAFTDFNNDPNGLFAMEIIEGETVTLEYYQPASVTDSPVISISDIAYIFRGVFFETVSGKDNGRGGSDWCMINVNCPEGDDWQNEKRGVVRQYMILPDGWVGWCSGSLINNTNWDLAPYVLSAHHCGEGCSSSHFNQWVFYFKYEAATCYGTSGPSNFTITGCQLKAEGDRYTGSDFALYHLNQDPPDSHEPYWNGWNRTNTPSTSGVGIHHPMGDIKKISTYTQTLTSSQWNNNGVLSHWKVFWSATENGLSIVESGSSGSPLFDYNHNIVGDLGGGPEDNCNNPAYSLYGKVYWSWDKMGSAPAQQLKYWLDPQNTGEDFLPGTEGIAPIVDFAAGDPTIPPGASVNFYDLSLGTPVEWEWTFTGGEPATSDKKNPTGIVYNTYGSFTVKLTASNPYGSDTETKTAYIIVADPPAADFYAADTELVAGEAAYFFDASVQGPTSWNWQFEGGTPSASFVKNPGPIYYMVPGVYQVKLTAINDFGSDVEIKNAYITVLGPPVANFAASQTVIPIGTSVDFFDLSSGNPSSWNWNFQGGTPAISTLQNPQGIIYNQPGSFNVSLEVNGDLGTDDTTMVGYITVVAPPAPNFTCPNRYILAGSSTTFTDYSTGNPTSWLWEFEGGTPATSAQQDPGAIVYAAVGDYDVALTVSNEYGSQCVTKPSYIHVGDVPQADFTADQTFIAVGETIDFIDLTLNNPTAWNWVFEGGVPATASVRNPSNIAYNQVGVFDVTLTVTNSYGQDTEVKNNYVEVGYVGIEDKKLTAENVDLYPNPTTGEVMLHLKGNLNDVISLTFFNSMGERILEIARENGIHHQMQISLTGNPPGLYYLSVKTNEDLIVKRITLVK